MAYRREIKKRKKKQMQPNKGTIELEIDFLKGLSSFVIKELNSYGLEPIQSTPTSLRLAFRGNPSKLNNLKTVVAVYRIIEFEIPRPKALLGRQNFQILLDAIKNVMSQKQKYKAFRINAAGSESSVYKRLAQEIAKSTGLKYEQSSGELLLRIRKSQNNWQVLIRQSPKALSARNWRLCNMPGGLNASVAYAMNEMAKIKRSDNYLNAMTGSGSLLIENNQAAEKTGIDNNEKALSCAAKNIEAAKVKAKLLLKDALNTSLKEAGYDVITADLPWGDAIGNHENNTELYRAFLLESARISNLTARLVLLTHELRIFEKIMQEQDIWKIKKELQVYHGGHYPKIFLLMKKS